MPRRRQLAAGAIDGGDKITVRLPDELSEDVTRLAKRARKSKNRWIVDLLNTTVYGGEEPGIPMRVDELAGRVAELEATNEDLERRLSRLEAMAYER